MKFFCNFASMKNILIKIALLFTLTIFLLSTTGIFLIEHQCYQEQQTNFHFVKNNSGSCCAHATECCTTEQHHGKDACGDSPAESMHHDGDEVLDGKTCCVNKVIFNKTTSPQSRSNSTENPISFVSCLPSILLFAKITPAETYLMSYNKPPPKIPQQIFIAISSFLL